MAKDSASPVSFRLSAEDRRLVEMVAAYHELSVSDFIRRAVVQSARAVLEQEGADKVLEVVRESNSRLNEQRLELYQQAAEDATRRPRNTDRAPTGC